MLHSEMSLYIVHIHFLRLDMTYNDFCESNLVHYVALAFITEYSVSRRNTCVLCAGRRIDGGQTENCFAFSPLLSSVFLQISLTRLFVLIWVIFTGHGGGERNQWGFSIETP